jgi:hypothetical protein
MNSGSLGRGARVLFTRPCTGSGHPWLTDYTGICLLQIARSAARISCFGGQALQRPCDRADQATTATTGCRIWRGGRMRRWNRRVYGGRIRAEPQLSSTNERDGVLRWWPNATQLGRIRVRS